MRALAALAVALAPWACAAPGPEPPDSPGERTLFDGSTLDGWSSVSFGGEGEVELSGGELHLGFGSPLTGVVWDGPPPAGEYEIEVACRRLAGTDFFTALTFPVGDAHASVVLGGWGGALTGLSCVDGFDASENDTRSFRSYRAGQEYVLRVAVTRDAVRAWLDGEELFSQPRNGHRFEVRTELLACRPLGLASYNTRGAVRSVRVRERR
ncbi:MAG: DUF1080 domain-containing protein [Planctomycetota bacterium]